MITAITILLISFPLLEICLFIKIGEIIGLINTLILTLTTGALGFIILKVKAKSLFKQFPSSLIKEAVSKKKIFNQLLYLIAGLFLILPGFLSDLIGVSIFFNFIRTIYLKILKNFLIRQLILKKIRFQTFKTNPKDFNQHLWKVDDSNLKNQKKRSTETESRLKKEDPPYKNLSPWETNHSKAFSNVIDFNSRRKKDH